ncbi:MAG: hypothetical protein MUF27_14910 [Acidobacteria bacterium]|jgi:hypothetical protein|nr:hypothetical protein [Acidobacteriota bacterium]
MNGSENGRRPPGGGAPNGDDRSGVELLRRAVERVAAELPDRREAAEGAGLLAARSIRSSRWRALAAAAAVLVAVAGAAWVIGTRGPGEGGARVAESELRVELFRVRGRAVPATVTAPAGAGSVLVIPQVRREQGPPAPRGEDAPRPESNALPGGAS